MSITDRGATVKFSDHYRSKIFTIWYNAGKPNHRVLYNMMPPDETTGALPKQGTLADWMAGEFTEKALELDRQVMEQINSELVAEKVEMLRRHSKTGQMMHDEAVRWIETHKDDLTASTAIRMLVEGIRIERESRGLPEALKKMMSMNDEELLEEVQTLLSNAPAAILPPSTNDN